MNNVVLMFKRQVSTTINECDGAAVLSKLQDAIIKKEPFVRIQTKNAALLVVMSELVFAVSEEE